MFTLKNVTVSVAGVPIIQDLNLEILSKEMHVLMGPNGSGKSTLSLSLAGHPAYAWGPKSQACLNQVDLLPLSPDKRAQHGLFLSFQQPVAVPGISVQQLIKTMEEHLHPQTTRSFKDLKSKMIKYCEILNVTPDFLTRSINDGFSGGEQKRLEMLQLLIAEPQLAILDEIDSGLDIDAIKSIAAAIEYARREFGTSFLVVTHYRRIVDQLTPTYVHILVKGKIVKSDGMQLIDEIERDGYGQYLN